MKPDEARFIAQPPTLSTTPVSTPSQTYRGPFQSRKRWGVLEAGPPLFDIMAKPQTPCARRKHMRAMHSGRNWDPQICSRSRYLLRQMVHCNAQQRAKVNTPCSYRCFPGSWQHEPFDGETVRKSQSRILDSTFVKQQIIFLEPFVGAANQYLTFFTRKKRPLRNQR